MGIPTGNHSLLALMYAGSIVLMVKEFRACRRRGGRVDGGVPRGVGC